MVRGRWKRKSCESKTELSDVRAPTGCRPRGRLAEAARLAIANANWVSSSDGVWLDWEKAAAELQRSLEGLVFVVFVSRGATLSGCEVQFKLLAEDGIDHFHQLELPTAPCGEAPRVQTPRRSVMSSYRPVAIVLLLGLQGNTLHVG